jgi:hypothetical protein
MNHDHVPAPPTPSAEARRLAAEERREENWKRWGPYLSERQWGTVREDYSAEGNAWRFFPHDHARMRAYRWGEDGLLGITDRQCRLCFSLALWNGNDPILKERLFGLTNQEGNHGEDVKECYYYLDATPTSSYLKGLYKYPHSAYPYGELIRVNGDRSLEEREYEISETGAFDEGRYFDVSAEYAKAGPEDICVVVRVANRGPEPAPLHVLPTLWFRNTWVWGCRHEGCTVKPRLERAADDPFCVVTRHDSLEPFRWMAGDGQNGAAPELLFTDNETNHERIWGSQNWSPFVKDAFEDVVIRNDRTKVNPDGYGTKVAAWYRLDVPAGGEVVLKLRLVRADAPTAPADRAAAFGAEFDAVVATRRSEADEFYNAILPARLGPQERRISRQAYAGLLWSKQFYHYVVEDWLDGDPSMPPPPAVRSAAAGRNTDWRHLFSRDILSMPDKWEYPWFAAWDLAFHMIPMARLDPAFARHQLELLLREWYMHPNGQIPAYEFHFDDVNPPVHAWAALRVYEAGIEREGRRDTLFLSRIFQKLLMNFTWWVNRKDPAGRHLFSGGFLGLDNIGLFDRSQPLPRGGTLAQADGTAWMGFYCATMLEIALELAQDDPAYEDIASKFFEHFVAIVDAINHVGGCGLWNEEDGFYYDQLAVDGRVTPLRIRSMVGLIPLSAVVVLDEARIDRLPGFKKRLDWFMENRADLARHIAYMERDDCPTDAAAHRLLAIPSRAKLERLLRRVLDETEFLSPYGVRSLSRAHRDDPFRFDLDGQDYTVGYVPGESDARMFGGNSNWRGPVWFPVNYLLIDALDRYHRFYGDGLRVECPVGSRRMLTLAEVADELRRRLARLFLPDPEGARPCHGRRMQYAHDPHWRELLLFYEYFDGDTGRGCGANHQTGWTALVASCIAELPDPAWVGYRPA